ncbi:MAG TPA: hypothetical protein VD930_13530 [Gemmatimonadales bacterium]|nr:hypothetical protein [Gemmatimonadales bacterium]
MAWHWPWTRLEPQVQTVVQTVTEAVYPSTDPDARHSATALGSNYTRRLSADLDRDLSPADQDRMIKIAAYLYDANYLAKRVLEIFVDWLLGDGVTVVATDKDEESREEVQAIIDAFWHDPYNKMDQKLPVRVLELHAFGEQILTARANPVDGFVRLGVIDPSLVKVVVPDPENCERKVAVGVSRPGSLGTELDWYKVIECDERPESESFRRMAFAALGEVFVPPSINGMPGEPTTFVGSVLLFQINKLSAANRGRSSLLCLSDWVDGLDKLVFGEMDRMELLRSFVWDVTLTGATPTVLDDWLKQHGKAPKAGSIIVHNEGEVWKAETPDLKAVDGQITIGVLMDVIATGAGVAKTWINGTLDVNRASASEMNEPTIKHLVQAQRTVKYMIETIITLVLDQAELAGQLPRRSGARPEPWAFVVQMPEIRQKDVASSAQAFSQVVNGLVAASAAHVLDQQTAQEIAAAMAGHLGIEVDLEEMRDRIEAEKKEAEQLAMMAPYGNGAGAQTPNGNGPVRPPAGQQRPVNGRAVPGATR